APRQEETGLRDAIQRWPSSIATTATDGSALSCGLLDAFSRKVVGWALQAHLRAELATSALTMAITARQPKRGALIHHSDRGAQYACTEYTEILAAHDIRPSMSRIGNPYDNAKAESFMKTLKQEEINESGYRNLSQARSDIGAFIETVYN